MKRTCFFILLLIFGFCINTCSAFAASVDNFHFESFDADYYISKDENGSAKMRVIETLVAIFPTYDQNHGIIRAIPFTSANGENVNAFSSDDLNLKVTRNGIPANIYSVETEDGAYYFKIRDKSDSVFVHGRQTYVLEYEFKNVVLNYDTSGRVTWSPENTKFQEIYWDTNGTGWSQSFGELTARVHFEEDVYKNLTGAKSCYVGVEGSTNQSRCKIATLSDGFEFSTQRLSKNENLTFAIGIKSGTFNVIKTENYALVIIIIIISLFNIPIIFLFLSVRKTNREKRNFYKNSPVPPQYVPPLGLSIDEVNFISLKPIRNTKVAILIDLAVRHKIELVKGERSIFGKTSWKINVKNTDNLNPNEIITLQLLNKGKVPIADSSFEIEHQSYSSTLAKLDSLFDKQTADSLLEKRLRESKNSDNKTSQSSISKNSILAIITFIFMFMFVIFALADTESGGILFGGFALGLFAFALIVASFILVRSTYKDDIKYRSRTKKSLELAIYLDGLRLYMEMAETERLNFLQSVEGADTSNTGIVKLYERLLPYAILFGIEKSWLNELNHYYEITGQPNWYSGSGPIIINDFYSFSSSANSSISSGSSSSSSSGSSGGGSSGGGGGGGGGGGC